MFNFVKLLTIKKGGYMKLGLQKKFDADIYEKAIENGNTVYFLIDCLYGKDNELVTNTFKYRNKYVVIAGTTNERKKEMLVTTLKSLGVGFVMENNTMAEAIKVWRSTRNTFIVKTESTDKSISKGMKVREIYIDNIDGIIEYLDEYFEGVNKYFVEGWDNSIINKMYQRLKIN